MPRLLRHFAALSLLSTFKVTLQLFNGQVENPPKLNETEKSILVEARAETVSMRHLYKMKAVASFYLSEGLNTVPEWARPLWGLRFSTISNCGYHHQYHPDDV
ncbi:hypothetical protein BDP81DRAFT_16315 [Colletotrichum phormii]|uniref:Uncharacterized protein n=1 Tax=Colletotrichum phormii TaxID=359342 RepID=A0AAJ0A7V6_9PEZI|nr:uncharacterized protein BDP81DRAFT_16315 [Colletotrichum phormii]KAK1656155.1 hypothetical protein BDP81DRAFT_16315 [Colletotrichum phormii]